MPRRSAIACMWIVLNLLLPCLAFAAPFAHITNQGSSNKSVIDTATNTVVANVGVGNYPLGIGRSQAVNGSYALKLPVGSDLGYDLLTRSAMEAATTAWRCRRLDPVG